MSDKPKVDNSETINISWGKDTGWSPYFVTFCMAICILSCIFVPEFQISKNKTARNTLGHTI